MKKLLNLLSIIIVFFIIVFQSVEVSAVSTYKVNIAIDTKKERKEISPYIYGINDIDDLSNLTANFIKQGGERYTAYNWERNYSNAGTNNFNTNDNGLVSDYDNNQQQEHALVIRELIDKSKTYNIPFMVTTLPIGNYVSADENGPVLDVQVAPSVRWKNNVIGKDGLLSLTPNITDENVYLDEYVNYIVNSYGSAETGGIRGYALDNNISNWSTMHPCIYSKSVSIDEIMKRSIKTANAIKTIDGRAYVFGGQLGDFNSYVNFNNEDDWEKYKDSYNWFIDYYLKYMRGASEENGKRLLDVLDLYFYSENRSADKAINIRESKDYTDVLCNIQRMQSTRTLWDIGYTENSYIGSQYKQYIPLIPTVQASINKYYNGTKLGFSEYDFGGGGHISGGIAEVDALGIFGNEGVYYAALSPLPGNIAYQKSAINLYTNYDGNGNGFGNVSVKTRVSDDTDCSAYASTDASSDKVLKIIVTNKNVEKALEAEVNISAGVKYSTINVYGFNNENSKIREMAEVAAIENNIISLKMEPLSVIEIVLTSEEEGNIIKSNNTVKETVNTITTIVVNDTGSSLNNVEALSEEITGKSGNNTSIKNDPFENKKEDVPFIFKTSVIILMMIVFLGLTSILYNEIKNNK